MTSTYAFNVSQEDAKEIRNCVSRAEYYARTLEDGAAESHRTKLIEPMLANLREALTRIDSSYSE